MRVEAPFSQEQVDHINEFQRTGFMHPFTCPHCSGCSDRDLIASENELRCPNCDYRQTWVHDFMANGEAVANYRRMWARFGFDTKPLSRNPTGEDAVSEAVKCQLVFPVCVGEAEVRMETDKMQANACVPCGKEFQKRFPPQLFGLNIRPLPTGEDVDG